MAIAVAPEPAVEPTPAWWDDEVARLRETAAGLPGPARAQVRLVLHTLLTEPETGPGAALDIWAVLDALDGR